MTPAAQVASCGRTIIAPTRTSEPRGSLTTAERNQSCFSRSRCTRSASGPSPTSGAPSITTRVGSPPVCESTTRTRDVVLVIVRRPCSIDGRASTILHLRSRFDALADDRKDLLALRPFEREARRPDPFRAEPALLNGELDVLHELDVRVEVKQRHVPAVELSRLGPLAAAHQLPEALVLLRERQPQPRDPSPGAEHDALEDQVVHAAEDRVAVADGVVEVGDAAHVGGRLLDRDERLLVRQLGEHA